MKINVSPSEAEQILVSFFEKDLHRPVESVVIEMPVADNKPTIDLEALVTAVRRYRYKSDQKIAAIKEVRQICSNAGIQCGLVSAKCFVEMI